MEAQSALSTVTSRESIWRLHAEMRNVQLAQAEHAERLVRLERRQDDVARMKSVWEPTQNPPPGSLTNFDEERQHNLLGSLQLDQDDLPRRGASRANSVRFDESAIQAHWMQGSRSSGDFYPTRTGSGLGGHPMTERSSSYKSDGRQSSAGHSVHSTHSARPNILGLDTNFLLDQDPALEISRPPPGLFILGPVPSIIRCWLDTNFSHETLLYAAVCTGSCRSLLDYRLIDRLGLKDQIRGDKNGEYKIKLPVYLPEAVIQRPSSRSSSPTSQLPTLTVDFTIPNHQQSTPRAKAIQIFLGSDTLRMHSADVLLSQNVLTLFGDDHNKLSVPLVRPEDEGLFTGLYTTNTIMEPTRSVAIVPNSTLGEKAHLLTPIGVKHHTTGGSVGGNDSGISIDEHARLNNQCAQSPSPIPSPMAMGSLEVVAVNDTQTPIREGSSRGGGGVAASVTSSNGVLPSGADDAVRDEGSERRLSEDSHSDWSQREQKARADGENGFQRVPTRESCNGVWTSWRRDIGQNPNREGGSYTNSDVVNTGNGYQRPGRGRGMKVLRPSKPLTSTSPQPPLVSQTSSPVDGSSPTPQEGPRGQPFPKTRESRSWKSKHSTVGNEVTAPRVKEFHTPAKSRSANPIGGASAFGWLKQSQQKQSTAATE
ncbi:MAG: hypothetical protein M1839_006741 [Geoglossum umbratile]|nr:MAG: hypothetical protein M1839_006741 [Geoglossum umbratile]